MPIFEFTLRLSLAFILGASIGIERQWRQKSAGLRTNTLVSIGSAAFTLLSVILISTSSDPTRIISQIVTGIGFIGAGVIMKDGMSVQGLNTAATIWCSAAVGSLAGLGLWKEAVITALAVIITHVLLRPIAYFLEKDKIINNRNSTIETEYLLSITCKQEIENHIRGILMQMLNNEDKLLLKSLTSNDNDNPNYIHIIAEILTNGRLDSMIEKVAGRLTIEREVTKVKWEIIGQKSDE
ncbi:MAG TPA: MgtC/SapB family protein [Chitinophagaceae bacterium]|nr:MgtC/SapB family protein [Chitinophagaceae bacterium]